MAKMFAKFNQANDSGLVVLAKKRRARSKIIVDRAV